MPRKSNVKKVMVIGSGPITIGQAAEFDYAGTQACKALREEGCEVVLMNSNPATIMTDTTIADKVYVEPLNVEFAARVIAQERPDGLLPTLGGQTGLNLATQLSSSGILDKYGVELLGTPLDAIKKAEDRECFRELMRSIGEPVPESWIIETKEELEEIAATASYPLIIRPAYTLGGTGGGVAYNRSELMEIGERGMSLSLRHQILVERCLLGWKEIEYEVMRDGADNCITICNMENLDPMGIHTGDSIVIAPSQTLSDKEYQLLRNASLKIIRALGIEGGCNVQFALDPKSFNYYVIEVNPRVSRSSALASKATGYPIARVSAKIAIGLRLDEITNAVTQKTTACFEPALDYCVVKIPRWPFDKFKIENRTIGTQMKATGEVMAIDRSFEAALMKAIRSMEVGVHGLRHKKASQLSDKELEAKIKTPNDERLFAIAEAIRRGMSTKKIAELSAIDIWFLEGINRLVEMENQIQKASSAFHNLASKAAINSCEGLQATQLLRKAKQMGFSDKEIGTIIGMKEMAVRELRKSLGIKPVYKMVDTCAAEFEAQTPYFYSSYDAEDETESFIPKLQTKDEESQGCCENKKKVIVLGSGPIRIGQGIEFDYCSVHSVWALRDAGYESIIINNNPETVSTDFDTSDKLYFEPLTVEDVLNVIDIEKPEGIVVQFGGQTPLNIASDLAEAGVKILGTSHESIDLAEDRERFAEMMRKLSIPMPEHGMASSLDEALAIAKRIGYPLMVRPSYVLGGRGMEIVYDEETLVKYVKAAVEVSPERPILLDRFLEDAIEAEADAISDGKDAFVPSIMEHIELAGIHSGDSACVLPPLTIPQHHIDTIIEYTKRIAIELNVVGLMNIQYAIANDKVYVLEANPRASRTVPLVSKVTGVSMARLATQVILGAKLSELDMKPRRYPHYGVKESVFPFNMFPEVDPLLGPEMRSTGEVLGMADCFGLAFYKAQAAAGYELPKEGTVLVTVANRDKQAVLPAVKKLSEMGFSIIATSGTARFLAQNGINVTEIKKLHEGRPNIVDVMHNGQIRLLINTPAGKESFHDDSYIRKAAIKLKVPYVTTAAAAVAAAEGIQAARERTNAVKSLQEYHKEVEILN